ncbi:AGAP004149-PA-like protein [Anopheles sinensis]|uniref:AGAP004149-PA-like protein n=1 Tax=Anopheles sinensis TaxID=74873 RepID=A0A084WTM5_ANOSI|nr:AGAP004149-PA-like protein [Anopheles sinensis]
MQCRIGRPSLPIVVLTLTAILNDVLANPWGNYYDYNGYAAPTQVYQFNQRVEHHRTRVPDSVPASSGTINCSCTKLRYCTKILEMLKTPKSSYGNFNSKLKQLACGYGTDNEPNICCPHDDSWLRDDVAEVGNTHDRHHSSEEEEHDGIGWDEGYTNRKSDGGQLWSRDRFKYVPATAETGKRRNQPTTTTTTNTPPRVEAAGWWNRKPHISNTIVGFEDPKTMKNCPPEIYPHDAEPRPTKPYVAPVMRRRTTTTRRPGVVLGENRLAEATTPLFTTTDPPPTTTELITTALPTVVPDRPMINAALCGLSVNTRIVGGETEVPGQFPWMARLAYRNRTSGRVTYRCAGSLITNRHVITVAHCVTNLIDELELTSIRLGDLECNAVTDTRCSTRFQDFEIERILPHESYDTPKYANDIALVKLRETTETYNIISPLCLPTDQYAPYALNLTGQMGIIAGWGSTSNRSNTPSPTLQWLRLPIVDTAGCANAYARYSVNSRVPIIVSGNQMCAQGQENRDACQGDSGGPLMNEAISSRDRFVLLGLVSFGPRTCGVSNFPGVYTRISSYIGWILANIMR